MVILPPYSGFDDNTTPESPNSMMSAPDPSSPGLFNMHASTFGPQAHTAQPLSHRFVTQQHNVHADSDSFAMDSSPMIPILDFINDPAKGNETLTGVPQLSSDRSLYIQVDSNTTPVDGSWICVDWLGIIQKLVENPQLLLGVVQSLRDRPDMQEVLFKGLSAVSGASHTSGDMANAETGLTLRDSTMEFHSSPYGLPSGQDGSALPMSARAPLLTAASDSPAASPSVAGFNMYPSVVIAASDTIDISIVNQVETNHKMQEYVWCPADATLYEVGNSRAISALGQPGAIRFVFPPNTMILAWEKDGSLASPAFRPLHPHSNQWLKAQVCNHHCAYRAGTSSLKRPITIRDHFRKCVYLDENHPLKVLCSLELAAHERASQGLVPLRRRGRGNAGGRANAVKTTHPYNQKTTSMDTRSIRGSNPHGICTPVAHNFGDAQIYQAEHSRTLDRASSADVFTGIPSPFDATSQYNEGDETHLIADEIGGWGHHRRHTMPEGLLKTAMTDREPFEASMFDNTPRPHLPLPACGSIAYAGARSPADAFFPSIGGMYSTLVGDSADNTAQSSPTTSIFGASEVSSRRASVASMHSDTSEASFEEYCRSLGLPSGYTPSDGLSIMVTRPTPNDETVGNRAASYFPAESSHGSKLFGSNDHLAHPDFDHFRASPASPLTPLPMLIWDDGTHSLASRGGMFNQKAPAGLESWSTR